MIPGFGMTPKGKAMLGLALAIVLLNALGLLVGALSIRGIPIVVIMVLVGVVAAGALCLAWLYARPWPARNRGAKIR